MNDSRKKARFGRSWLLCAGFCAFYLALAVYTSPRYGITWDQAANEWYIAERNLRYLLTLDESWLDFSRPVDFSMGGTHPDLGHTARPWRTQNFGNMLSAAGCRLFFVKLDLLEPVEAHHAPNFLLMAAALAAMFVFVRRNFGVAAALISLCAMAFQPRFWAHAHFNTKDFPYACMMVFTMLAARRAVLDRSAAWMVSASVLLGLAGATKPSAGLIPVIIFIWFLLVRKDESYKHRAVAPEEGSGRHRSFAAALTASPAVALAAFTAAWPYMWSDPVGVLRKYLAWYLPWAAKEGAYTPLVTLAAFVLVQPPAVLLFGSVGAVAVILRMKRGTTGYEPGLFLLLWAALPVLRMAFPWSHNYDVVRHFIEYAPPLGALTGVGAWLAFGWLADRLGFRGGMRRGTAVGISLAVILAPFAGWAGKLIDLHPNEIVYFNFLVGGPGGAEKLCGDCGIATDYWGSSYRQGMQWLNGHAEDGAAVIVPVAGHIVKATRKMWLRPDLKFGMTAHKSDRGLDSVMRGIKQRPVYFMYITRTRAYGKLVREVERRGRVEYAICEDGVEILKIVRVDD